MASSEGKRLSAFERVAGFLWGDDVLVVPEFCFGVQIQDQILRLCHEHTEIKWADYDSAVDLLRGKAIDCPYGSSTCDFTRIVSGT